MDAYLCLNIYKGWMKEQSPVFGSSKEVSVKRKRKRDEKKLRTCTRTPSKVAVSLLMVVLM